MPEVEFRIPASPHPRFFSQIAVFGRAVRALPWTRWRPRVSVWFGGPGAPETFPAWRPVMGDGDYAFVSDDAFARDSYLAQGDARFLTAAPEAAVVAMADADTLPLDDLEPVLDALSAAGAVGGVIAHRPFPFRGADGDIDDWRALSAAAGAGSPRFEHRYTMMDPETPERFALCPFYVNFGFVMIPATALERLAPAYLRIRRQIALRLEAPFFSAQIAFALAVAAAGVPHRALPMRYNFPNDAIAEAAYPDELSALVVAHYLRGARIDRQSIFAAPDAYARFLAMPLDGVDARVQRFARERLGAAWPFAATAAAAA